MSRFVFATAEYRSGDWESAPALPETAIPLWPIDVGEHAYYLVVHNTRPDHVKSVVDNCLNWTFASTNFGRETAWKYPG